MTLDLILSDLILLQSDSVRALRALPETITIGCKTAGDGVPLILTRHGPDWGKHSASR